MAGDWIKMRGGLVGHPKVIAMTRELQQNHEFRDWLTPGGGGAMNGQIVSTAASRAVTTTLLLCVWSASREHGKFVGEDLLLEHSTLADLDELANAPGVGEAMASVGWAQIGSQGKGIILPNFKEFNVPMSDAERAKGYRERQKKSVTEASRKQRDENTENVTPREEKRRNNPIVPSPKFSEFWESYPSARRIGKGKCLDLWTKNGFESVGDQIVLHVAAMKATPQWQKEDGKFIPSSQTYLNQRRFEDGVPEQPRPRLVI